MVKRYLHWESEQIALICELAGEMKLPYEALGRYLHIDTRWRAKAAKKGKA